MSTESGPHPFRRLSWLRRNKCRHCYVPKKEHPVNYWTNSRPIGDPR